MNFSLKNMTAGTLIILIVGTLIVTIGALYAYSYLTTVDGTVTIKTPANVTSTPTSLDWGSISQGEFSTKTVALTNNGETDTGILNFDATLPEGTSLTWDNFSPVLAGATENYTFTLTVDADAPAGTHDVIIEIYQDS